MERRATAGFLLTGYRMTGLVSLTQLSCDHRLMFALWSRSHQTHTHTTSYSSRCIITWNLEPTSDCVLWYFTSLVMEDGHDSFPKLGLRLGFQLVWTEHISLWSERGGEMFAFWTDATLVTAERISVWVRFVLLGFMCTCLKYIYLQWKAKDRFYTSMFVAYLQDLCQYI